ncbi:MAG: M20/M25/M40 family metallo-hydrolase [Deltaproteobacteria bacterium]|nr:M20/M25/M40 family metallo-hydrolase [Deltaproteobacteria bacterium]
MIFPNEWLEKMIRISTVTHQSNEVAVRFLVPLLRDSGLKVEEQKVVEHGTTFRNVIAYSHTPDASNLLVLHCHLDTVSAGNAKHWTKTYSDPFRATQVRDRIYGLGTADVKLDFLCKIWAARQTRPWKRPIALVGSYGEERGLIGTHWLLETKKIKPSSVLVGGPSNLALIYAHKGHLVCTVSLELDQAPHAKRMTKRWQGRAAHSATPQLGVNALQKGLFEIYKRGYGVESLAAGLDVNRIPDECEAALVSHQTNATKKLFQVTGFLDEQMKAFKLRKDNRFTPPYSTLSLNRARTVENKLELTFEVRTLPDLDMQTVETKFRAAMERLQVKIVGMVANGPLRASRKGRLLEAATEALKSCGIKALHETKSTSTGAALYSQQGAEALVFGPGASVGNIHRPNEFNSIRQLDAATRFYAALIKENHSF